MLHILVLLLVSVLAIANFWLRLVSALGVWLVHADAVRPRWGTGRTPGAFDPDQKPGSCQRLGD